jgi:hypothetical protein
MAELSDTHKIVISSNLYHLPRALMDIHEAGISNVLAVPAEAYWVAEETANPERRDIVRRQLSDALGPGPLADRLAAEIQGAADKLNKQYQPLSS